MWLKQYDKNAVASALKKDCLSSKHCKFVANNSPKISGPIVHRGNPFSKHHRKNVLDGVTKLGHLKAFDERNLSISFV